MLRPEQRTSGYDALEMSQYVDQDDDDAPAPIITANDRDDDTGEAVTLLNNSWQSPSPPARRDVWPRDPFSFRRCCRPSVLAALVLGASLCLSLLALLLAASVSLDWSAGAGGAGGVRGAASAAAAGGGLLTQLLLGPRDVTRIAFGSCTAYDLRPQGIWEQAVIPSQPDAWIWAGDMVYADSQPVDCEASPSYHGCTCEPGWLRRPPFMCGVANLTLATLKFQAQFTQQPGYRSFLEHMCPPPGNRSRNSGNDISSNDISGGDDYWLPGGGGLAGPPPGADTRVCPSPILGIYDDHDFSWNNGDRRLPNKQAFKNLFLDAIGEQQGSPRRSAMRGAEFGYKLRSGVSAYQARDVDILLLDGRYNRDPLPCAVRREWCEKQLDKEDASPNNLAWCRDYLLDPQMTGGNGSCCKADDQFANGWCREDASASHPLYRELCDPWHEHYGRRHYVIRDGAPAEPDPANPDDWASASPMCEVLGVGQRTWLQRALASSRAPVRLVVSGSVVFGNPVPPKERGEHYTGKENGECGGDDWDCYAPAQRNLIAMLGEAQHANGGCTVLLVGDYHMSDIKMVTGGSGTKYELYYGSGPLTSPLYQLMSSGMTNSTAKPGRTCENWRVDVAGLRPLGQCALLTHPGFGVVEVDWLQRQLSLQVRYAENGSIAQRLDVSLDNCLPLTQQQ